jgi:hypothetical protein
MRYCDEKQEVGQVFYLWAPSRRTFEFILCRLGPSCGQGYFFFRDPGRLILRVVRPVVFPE